MFLHQSTITYCGTSDNFTVIKYFLFRYIKENSVSHLFMLQVILAYRISVFLLTKVTDCKSAPFLCLFSRHVEHRNLNHQLKKLLLSDILAYPYFKLFHILVYISSAEGKYMFSSVSHQGDCVSSKVTLFQKQEFIFLAKEVPQGLESQIGDWQVKFFISSKLNIQNVKATQSCLNLHGAVLNYFSEDMKNG